MRIRLHIVTVALLLIAGCSSSDHNQPETSGNAAATPDEWASMRSVDACAVLDETALAPLGKVSDKRFAGASVHSCVATITAPDGAKTTARAFVGERAGPDAKPVDLAGVPAVQDSSCAVTVKVAGDDGISVSVQSDDVTKQCAEARAVATALHAQLKMPPQNPYSTPFHGKDPCQPIDQLAKQVGSLKSLRRPAIVSCEITGTSGLLLISQEIENLTDHQHGEPLAVGGKEAMRHQDMGQTGQCMVMVMLKEAPQDSFYTKHYLVSSTSDPCGKATNAANVSTNAG